MAAHRSEIILKHLAQELLTDEECQRFKQALQYFRISKSVTALCTQLSTFINTTEKMLILIELSNQIPKRLQEDFHKLCNLQYKNYETFVKTFSPIHSLRDNSKMLAKDATGSLRVAARKDERIVFIDEGLDTGSGHGTSVTSGIYSETDDASRNGDFTDGTSVNSYHRFLNRYEKARISKRSLSSQFVEVKQRPKSVSNILAHEMPDSNNVKRILLERRGDGSLGLTIRGGKEDGTPIVVHAVEQDGQAAKQGLCSGDRIIDVSGHDFRDTTHAEAVAFMRNAWNLILTVERSRQQLHSLPTQLDQVDKHDSNVETTKKLIVHPTKDGKVGCIISRHLQSRNVLVKTVEENSPASKSGLLSGDIIVKIEGLKVQTITDKQMSSLMQSRKVRLEIKRLVSGNVENGKFRREDSVFIDEDALTHSPPMTPNTYDSQVLSVMKTFDETLASTRIDSGTSVQTLHQNSISAADGIAARLSEKDDEENWFFSKQPHRYIQRHDVRNSYSGNTHQQRGRVAGPSGKIVYTRNRSTSPGTLRTSPDKYVKVRAKSQSPLRGNSWTDDGMSEEVVRAIQHALQKRQRAVRLSLYHTPDPTDHEWKLT